MLDGAMFTFADEGRAGQDDRQHGDVIDDLGQRAEPGLFQIRVVARAQIQVHRRRSAAAVTQDKIVDLAQGDLLDIFAAHESLRHAGGVNIQLNGRRTAGQHVALKVRRNIQHEGVIAGIHARIHFGGRDVRGRIEAREIEGGCDARRHWRSVFVHDGDGHFIQTVRHGRGRDVN